MTEPNPSGNIRIHVRSRRQAMDWSLALISQGIESAIDYSPENGWGLVVAETDHDRALGQIRQYRSENTRWPWRQTIHHKVLFDWASLGWVCLIVAVFWISSRTGSVYSAGVMDSAAVNRGEWWRLFTAIYLHADLGHLAANSGFGLILLGLAMGVYGTGMGLLAAYLAGAGGNAATWLLDPFHRSLGASGMVMGCLGLLAAHSAFASRRAPKSATSIVGGIVAGLMLFLLLGSSPGTDLAAHAGGFVCGLVVGLGLNLLPALAENPVSNAAAIAIFGFLTVFPWLEALSHGRGPQ